MNLFGRQLPFALGHVTRRLDLRLLQEGRYVLTAVQFLTRIPVPALAGFERCWLDRSLAYFPLTGLLVGGISAAVLVAASTFWMSPVPAILAVAAGIAVTGALHEDGLADTADGLVGGQSPAQRLAIMKDSRIGTYGACALMTALAIKAASLGMMATADAAWALIAAHMGARVVPVFASAYLTYAGDLDGAKVPPLMPTEPRLAFAVATGLVPLFAFPWHQAAAALAVAGSAAALLLVKAARSVGGQTGDILGAAEQVSEVAIVLVLAGNWM